MFDLILFDCDGVLIDSEIIAIRVESKLLAELGFQVSPEEIAARFCGGSIQAMRTAIEAQFGRPLPLDFETQALVRTLSAFEGELEAMSGIEALLAGLESDRCVASSSDLPRVHRSLELTGLYDAFAPHIFSAQMVERGKPAPDLFRYAAAHMGADERACLVVEDSHFGVAAARAAGMQVVGFTGGGHCAAGRADELREAGAAEVIDHMDALPSLLNSLGRSLRRPVVSAGEPSAAYANDPSDGEEAEAGPHRKAPLHVVTERVRLPNGTRLELDMVRHPGASAIVPFASESEVLLIRQFRHAAGGTIYEVPAGKLDPGETPLECAARELEEETGFEAGRLDYLGGIWTTPGFTDERIHLFAAFDLRPTAQRLEDDELIEVLRLDLRAALDLIWSGELSDAKSALALVHAARRVGGLR